MVLPGLGTATDDQPVIPGRLFVISGPSGAGKGTLIKEVLPRLRDAELAVSATTRPMRAGEAEGREYFFLSEEDFARRVSEGDFLEHVRYGSYSYGTLRSEVEKNLATGRTLLLEIELEGARSVRKNARDAVSIFIRPPDFEELKRRLVGRDTEDPAEIEKRLERAREELASADEFDYIVVNDNVDRAADELERIIIDSLKGG
ncbi:MAG: guanylate kinase [Gaiellales bacterium]|nr:MAG: guanylate kinase [Gaiellales bacterium]